MRKTKIICTLGPACDDEKILREMMVAGMNIARFNFSHGTQDEHKVRLDRLRSVARELGKPIATLLDTKGPEIRTGRLKGSSIKLEEGSEIILTSREVEGTEKELSISYKNLPGEVKKGDHILIADGEVDLEVLESDSVNIRCSIRVGGEIGGYKNVNVPGIKVGLPAVTDKDKEDILFAIREGFDFIAASFSRSAAGIMEIRSILDAHNSPIHIIAKIESGEGVENFNEILNVSDGIMVARGDLGVQLPMERVPLIQKEIIRECNEVGKPVITATQMLDSMIELPRPTRAESTDVANAILDGTDAVMLSGETAIGRYPVEAVRMMAKIAEAAEEAISYEEIIRRRSIEAGSVKSIPQAICHAACQTAFEIDASAIVVPTRSGNTARMLSHYRPSAPIVAVAVDERVQRQLLLPWGIYPLTAKLVDNTDDMIAQAIREGIRADLIQNWDTVVIVASVPIFSPVVVNLIKVHMVSTILAKGIGREGFGSFVGRVRKVHSAAEAMVRVLPKDVLVIKNLDESFSDVVSRVGAIVVEGRSVFPQEELLKRDPHIPVIVEVKDAMSVLEEGLIVTVDGTQGIVYEGNIEMAEDRGRPSII
ncbi:MAG: pyruvate kinase [bacterium]